MKTPEFLALLESNLKSLANQDAAIIMSRYMKNHFEFFGISSPLRKEALRDHIQNQGYIPEEELDKIVKWCYVIFYNNHIFNYAYYYIGSLN